MGQFQDRPLRLVDHSTQLWLIFRGKLGIVARSALTLDGMTIDDLAGILNHLIAVSPSPLTPIPAGFAQLNQIFRQH